ncbi:MAG: HlyD family efflux transporter periplasmic adaptor subunit [Planctomycetia bacterium]|nr:HlyD family efflux transporter periplasmic adaptor subunit [Planctomycetia bacterium]
MSGSRSRRRKSRRGALRWKLAALVVAVGAAGGGAYWKLAPGAWKATVETPLTGQVVVGKFVHEIVERGDIQSSANVDVRSEVQLRSSASASLGVAILEIVPEGTFVEEGDFLVRLDDAVLQNELTLQTINCNASQASVIQAETTVETAKLALSEYESGTFKQEEEQLQSEIFVAEEAHRRSQEYVRYSERLAAKGYVTPIQLEADRFAVSKAAKELEVARTKQVVLHTYSKQKMMKQLESEVKTAEAKLQATLEIHSVEKARLDRIKTQIAKCVIAAPKAGQVVYANDQTSSGEPIVIEEGRMIRERQVIIRLPNPKQMQVLAKINESRIDLVRPGMLARVKIDALPDVELRGRVKKVSEYPLQQSSSFSAHIKEYATEIEILNPPPGLRPGMTAQAAVIAEERDGAAQVPLQAVMERDGRYYCLVHTPQGLQAKQVQVGPTNSKLVVIESGLEGTEQVVMTPKQYVDLIALPTPIDFPARVKPTAIARSHPAERTPAEARLAKSETASRIPKREPIKRPKAMLNDTSTTHGAGL